MSDDGFYGVVTGLFDLCKKIASHRSASIDKQKELELFLRDRNAFVEKWTPLVDSWDAAMHLAKPIHPDLLRCLINTCGFKVNVKDELLGCVQQNHCELLQFLLEQFPEQAEDERFAMWMTQQASYYKHLDPLFILLIHGYANDENDLQQYLNKPQYHALYGDYIKHEVDIDVPHRWFIVETLQRLDMNMNGSIFVHVKEKLAKLDQCQQTVHKALEDHIASDVIKNVINMFV
jgi:hypothetical protein